jgi:betaine-aldehyde dehydrogenase
MNFADKLYIDGQWVSPVKGGTFTTYKPTTGEPLCEVANATAEDVDLAVKAAQRSMNSSNWGYSSTGAQRAVILRNFGKLIEERSNEIAELDSLDNVNCIFSDSVLFSDSILGKASARSKS